MKIPNIKDEAEETEKTSWDTNETAENNFEDFSNVAYKNKLIIPFA